MKNKKQIYTFSDSLKSRMQRFEKPHADREPQFGHPWFMTKLIRVRYSWAQICCEMWGGGQLDVKPV